MCILGYIALAMCTSARWADADLGLGQAGSNLKDVFSAQLPKNDKKLHIMQIAMQKSQEIECSVHTVTFQHPHYISFRPVNKRNRIFTPFTRVLLLKVHIANPDSNLVVLNHAYEYWQPMLAFNENAMVQKNEINIKGLQQLLRF